MRCREGWGLGVNDASRGSVLLPPLPPLQITPSTTSGFGHGVPVLVSSRLQKEVRIPRGPFPYGSLSSTPTVF